MRSKSSRLLVLAGMLVMTGGFGGSTQSEPTSAPAAASSVELPDGLDVRLSSVGKGRDDAPKQSATTGAPLDAAAIANLLARVAPLPADPAARQSFSFRASTLPPPRSGITVVDAFEPKADTPPAIASGPLTVERYAPSGNVPVAPLVSVTFSEPMVAVGSHAESLAAGVPAAISPSPPGQWRWLGTRTLIFDPVERLPMATHYVVTVKADAKSVAGHQLGRPYKFEFTTPAPHVIASYPEEDDPQPLTPVLFIEFDQKMDWERAAASVVITDDDERTVAVRAATLQEVQANEAVRTLVEAAEAAGHGGRYFTLVPRVPLPKGTRLVVTVKKGTPSMEGPLTTERDQSFELSTFYPLTLVAARCGDRIFCSPGEPWEIRFNNPVDEAAFDPQSIRISPELPDASIKVSGGGIKVQGASASQTRYQVTVPATLRDVFGQTLGDQAQRVFTTGAAESKLFGDSYDLAILDPTVKARRYSVFSVGVAELAVQIRRVTPDDWSDYLESRRFSRLSQVLPGMLVFDQVVRAGELSAGVSRTTLDLSAALNDQGFGHALVTVEPKDWSGRGEKPRHTTWVQATAIGLDGFVDRDEFLAWTTNLVDGTPLAATDLELLPDQARQRTDAAGLARLPLAAKAIDQRPHLLIARRGQDVAFLPASTYPLREVESREGRWYRQDPAAELAWFVYDDRQLYRPGETVSLKGWLRLKGPGKGGDIADLQGRVPRVTWVAKDSEGNELAKGEAPVNLFGGFNARIALPNTAANLGNAWVMLSVPKSAGFSLAEYEHTFAIEEFRRPEFEVSTSASGGPYVVGKSADVTVTAAYFAGGALSAAPVEWRVTSDAAEFVPPNRSDYAFGTWTPWWERSRMEDLFEDFDGQVRSYKTATAADGTQTLHLDFLSAKPARAMSVTATATVADVNRRAAAASETLLVHPADVYVGVKRASYFVNKGSPIELDLLVVDHEGNAVAGREVRVQAFRLENQRKNGRWVEVRTGVRECRIVSSTSDQHCELATTAAGVYQVEATVTDAANRPSQTSVQVWVSGAALPSQPSLQSDAVTLIPDKQNYVDGDTARILVLAPFYPADGLLTVRRSGIVTTRAFHLDGASTVLDIPIRDAYVPNVWAQVDLVGSKPRVGSDEKQRQPAFAAGTIRLAVPPQQRALMLEVTPRDKEVTPGARTKVQVKVVDATGRAQPNVEVALTVVDEAVLALADYKTPDPLAALYVDRGDGTLDLHTREWLQLEGAYPRNSALEEVTVTAQRRAEAPFFFKKSMSEVEDDASIVVRKDFSALAAFAPEQRTDANGIAMLEFKVPDNLTRYRIVAVAADKVHSFGSGEASFTARRLLMVRPSPPRFLNYGDRFELPVVLQNQTDKSLSVDLAVRADNANLLAAAGQRVAVPAHDRVEVRFPMATGMPGTARFQMVAAAAGLTDAAEVAVPVRTPATTEAFATYGEIDAATTGAGIRQQVRVPMDVLTTYGGLQLTTSSTQLAALTDAFLYLQNYPFECAEQVASRVLAVAALRDVLGQFQASGLPPKQEIDAAVARDLTRLASLQRYDGSFGFWNRGGESWPYLSIHASHALARAKQKGYDVPDELLENANDYLQNIEEHIPGDYPADVRQSLVAYSLWVRKLLGASDPSKARQLLAKGRDELPTEALGWLLGVLAADAGSQSEVTAIIRRLGNRVTETAAAAHWVDDYADGDYLMLHSSRRADAIILESLIRAQPKSDLIAKIVRGLLAEQRRGRWESTQENVFVLLAMEAYFAKYEKATPDMVARAWLGPQLAEEVRFAGRSAARHHLEIPMPQLGAPGTEQPLIVGTTGAGRLYYRVGLTYAPSNLALGAADRGFAVERRYEAVDDPADVRRSDDGVWHIKAGALVRVRVGLVAESRRYHVALVDPLPAGLEALNAELAGTEPIPSDPEDAAAWRKRSFWWWLGPWYEHQNLRDDRAEAFTSVLPEGVHKYTYVARATTPGNFVVPPAKAEEMYAPETFGRSATDRVVIE